MKSIRSMAWLVALPLISACEPTTGGTYLDVVATLDYDSCGTGAVDAPDSWEFQVRVDRDDDTIDWYDVEEHVTLTGSIEDDELSIATSEEVTVTSASGDEPGCSLHRRDRYEGVVDGTGNDILRIDGDITLTYSQATGYECDELVGTSDGFDELPCEVDYIFVATPSS